jgi:DNA-binding response OmpR family regulator
MSHITLDKSKCQVLVGGKIIQLEPCEFDIFWLLAEKPEKVFKGGELFSRLKRANPRLTEQPFRNDILRLYFKLNQRYIQMLDDDGFRFRA